MYYDNLQDLYVFQYVFTSKSLFMFADIGDWHTVKIALKTTSKLGVEKARSGTN